MTHHTVGYLRKDQSPPPQSPVVSSESYLNLAPLIDKIKRFVSSCIEWLANLFNFSQETPSTSLAESEVTISDSDPIRGISPAPKKNESLAGPNEKRAELGMPEKNSRAVGSHLDLPQKTSLESNKEEAWKLQIPEIDLSLEEDWLSSCGGKRAKELLEMHKMYLTDSSTIKEVREKFRLPLMEVDLEKDLEMFQNFEKDFKKHQKNALNRRQFFENPIPDKWKDSLAWKSPSFASLVAFKSLKLFKFIDADLQKDPSFVLHLIVNQEGSPNPFAEERFFSQLSPELMENKQFLINLLEEEPNAIEWIPKKMRLEMEVILVALHAQPDPMVMTNTLPSLTQLKGLSSEEGGLSKRHPYYGVEFFFASLLDNVHRDLHHKHSA